MKVDVITVGGDLVWVVQWHLVWVDGGSESG